MNHSSFIGYTDNKNLIVIRPKAEPMANICIILVMIWKRDSIVRVIFQRIFYDY